ncbi:unnamed protein product [Linum tenue]|uniref:Exocyst subunit Exo70 family protein n=1 Tax=Linum tenue TaxID=586396 RepID=A0AAV0JRL2_9ROSI|nr:unnamed protein product [Linum tenue]
MTLTRKGVSHLFQSTNKSIPSLTSFSASPSHFPPSSPLHHTFSASMMEEDIENAASFISKWDLDSSSIHKVTPLFQNNEDEASKFLKCVKDLRRAMHFLLSQHSDPEKLAICQKLIQIAMRRLEKEFYQILSANWDHLNPESVSGQSSSEGSLSNVEDDQAEIRCEEDEFITRDESVLVRQQRRLPGVGGISDLKSIADCMITCGYTKECVKIYLLMRKSIVDEGLYRLGVVHYKASQIQRLNSEALENMIKNWLNAVNRAVKNLFLGEKVLCGYVFSDYERIRELCFSEVVKEAAANLFRFPELAAKNKNLKNDRIFPLMDIYEALVDLWPEIEPIFSFESISSVKQQAHSSLMKLGESIRQTLSEFESAIQKDSSKSQVPGGGIHPLNTSAMDYLSSLADYGSILSDIVADSLPESTSKLPESYYESPTTTSVDAPSPAVSTRLAWLILVLLCKLDRKAEQYKDASLSYLFLANNMQFIIEKVCTTRLRVVLGEDWVFNHAKKAQQYATKYETMAWNKVFSFIPSKPFPEEQSPEAAAECFRKFKAAFEESHRKQMSWVVPNRKFRDELKVSIAKKLVPAYREFYDNYVVGSGMLSGDSLEVLMVKFGPDDLENYLSDLFHGGSSSGSSSSNSSRGCMPR